MTIEAKLDKLLADVAELKAKVAVQDQATELAIDRVLTRRQSAILQPLSKIMGKKAPAARAFLRRHPDLAALGTPVGHGRLEFRVADVEAWAAARRAAKVRK